MNFLFKTLILFTFISNANAFGGYFTRTGLVKHRNYDMLFETCLRDCMSKRGGALSTCNTACDEQVNNALSEKPDYADPERQLHCAGRVYPGQGQDTSSFVDIRSQDAPSIERITGGLILSPAQAVNYASQLTGRCYVVVEVNAPSVPTRGSASEFNARPSPFWILEIGQISRANQDTYTPLVRGPSGHAVPCPDDPDALVVTESQVGSGFVVGNKVITSAHVVEGYTSVAVCVSGKWYSLGVEYFTANSHVAYLEGKFVAKYKRPAFRDDSKEMPTEVFTCGYTITNPNYLSNQPSRVQRSCSRTAVTAVTPGRYVDTALVPQPGNSGGPITDGPNGPVIAIWYAQQHGAWQGSSGRGDMLTAAMFQRGKDGKPLDMGVVPPCDTSRRTIAAHVCGNACACGHVVATKADTPEVEQCARMHPGVSKDVIREDVAGSKVLCGVDSISQDELAKCRKIAPVQVCHKFGKMLPIYWVLAPWALDMKDSHNRTVKSKLKGMSMSAVLKALNERTAPLEFKRLQPRDKSMPPSYSLDIDIRNMPEEDLLVVARAHAQGDTPAAWYSSRSSTLSKDDDMSCGI